MENIEEKCTHDCSTCGGSCGDSCGENGEAKPDVWDRIGNFVDGLYEDDVLEMLQKMTEEMEKE